MKPGGNWALLMAAKTLGLFFGSSTCYTDLVSEKIANIIRSDHPEWSIVTHNIAEQSIELSIDYNFALYGIPTWDYGELQEDWDNQWDCLQTLNLSNQCAAIYGLGDQIGYPKWYQDAIGFLFSQLQACGAKLYGLWPTNECIIDQWVEDKALLNHVFEQSQGVTDDNQFFLGLPLDEENQPNLTLPRLKLWLQNVLSNFDKR